MKHKVVVFSILMLVAVGACNEDKLLRVDGEGVKLPRGHIVRVNQNLYRYDYYDVSEADSKHKSLRAMGYQGGGYSWAGIVFGILTIKEPSLIPEIELDPEGDGLAVWAKSEEPLLRVAELVDAVTQDNDLLLQAIKVAENEGWME